VSWSLPAVVCAVLSLFFAAWARKPNFVPGLPSVEAAVGYAEAEGKKEAEAQAAFLGQWDLVCRLSSFDW
jgi:hypothetical protein